jgi:hypothetical protein
MGDEDNRTGPKHLAERAARVQVSMVTDGPALETLFGDGRQWHRDMSRGNSTPAGDWSSVAALWRLPGGLPFGWVMRRSSAACASLMVLPLLAMLSQSLKATDEFLANLLA